MVLLLQYEQLQQENAALRGGSGKSAGAGDVSSTTSVQALPRVAPTSIGRGGGAGGSGGTRPVSMFEPREQANRGLPSSTFTKVRSHAYLSTPTRR